MEKWKTDLNKLQNFMDSETSFGAFSDPDKVFRSQIRTYKNKYVNTVKFNSKSGEFEDYDQRTKTFYNDKDVNKFISNDIKQKRKAFFLEGAGTETPEKDLEYLQAKNKLNYLKNENQSNVWKIRNSFSNKIEGGGTVYEQEWLKSIKNAEAELLKLRAGTKYERDLLKQIKLKRDSQ